MSKRLPDDNDASAQSGESAQSVDDAPEYVDAMQAKRRALHRSLVGAGGLSPGIHGIMTTDEDVFGERMLGPEPRTQAKSGDAGEVD